MGHINTLFKGAFKNIHYFNLSFYGNIKAEEAVEAQVSTQLKKEYRKSQKRPLEDLVIPDEVHRILLKIIFIYCIYNIYNINFVWFYCYLGR